MQRKTPLVIVVLAAVAALAFSLLTPGVSAEEPDTGANSGATADGVVAIYFHGNVRCATCRKIESYAHEAVQTGFSEAIQEGALAWRVINVDEADNAHFIQDFQLVTKSVVLAEYREGQVVRWENLDKVWQLVRSKDRFVDYIQSETREFLGEG
ncbi:MAG: nitrophenyl compound nitroreductase subunit ArsF family protein [Thermoanaerobaculales bacterium]|jgi:hypothetical protein|nr:nitrophenyl compound nitroreductase subunit ArsF family protein [Thermoanaerobaculales bacterium]